MDDYVFVSIVANLIFDILKLFSPVQEWNSWEKYDGYEHSSFFVNIHTTKNQVTVCIVQKTS